MTKEEQIILIGIIGFVIIAVSGNFWLAVGVIILMWSNNLERTSQRKERESKRSKDDVPPN